MAPHFFFFSSTWPHLYGPRLRQRHQLDVPAHPHLPRPKRLRLLRSRPARPRPLSGTQGFRPRSRRSFSFFDSIKRNPKFHKLPSFLYGESMGGAICLLIHFKDPKAWNGGILVAPMCKISDNVRPRWPIPEILSLIAKFLPTLAIVPTVDLLDKSVKVPEKKIVAAMNAMRYQGKPRLGTVAELLRVTDCVNRRLSEVSLPFIVVHGRADVVTDPEVSRNLYEAARSVDKTIKIFDGMMHSLLFGETDENVEIVRRDILSWLNQRS